MRAVMWTLVGGLLACEAERPASAFADRDAALAVDAGAGSEPDASRGDGVFRADGQWLLFIQDRYCLYAAGQSVDYLVWAWYLAELTPLGPGATGDELYVRQRLQMCGEEMSPVVGGLQTYVPAAIPASLPEQVVDAFALGRRPGDTWLSQELVELWGVGDLSVDTPLPESADDPAVVDQDGDGAPGVTITIGNDFCDVHLVQRTRYRIRGALVSEHRVEGAVWSQVNQQVLGATLPFCASENQLEPAPDGTRVVLQRIDGRNGGRDLDADGDGAVSCAEVLAAREDLVGAGTVVKDAPDTARCR
jgi:hypothetical protein